MYLFVVDARLSVSVLLKDEKSPVGSVSRSVISPDDSGKSSRIFEWYDFPSEITDGCSEIVEGFKDVIRIGSVDDIWWLERSSIFVALTAFKIGSRLGGRGI